MNLKSTVHASDMEFLFGYWRSKLWGLISWNTNTVLNFLDAGWGASRIRWEIREETPERSRQAWRYVCFITSHTNHQIYPVNYLLSWRHWSN